MPKKTETTNDMFKDVQAICEPWVKAAQVWQDEMDKMREVALENMNRGLDDSHRMAKESLTMMSAFSVNMHKQVNTQMDRSRELFTSLVS
jgi:hypothetical protein